MSHQALIVDCSTGLIFSKPVKFYGINICKINCFNYGVNIAYFMPRMHKKVPGNFVRNKSTKEKSLVIKIVTASYS